MTQASGVFLYVNPDVVDVFTGKGWENWSRFELKRMKGRVYPQKVGGKSLTQDQFKELCESLK